MLGSIGIAGAGLAGRLCAWYLVHAGYRVSLFDEGDPDGSHSCSHVGAGMLSPWAELAQAEAEIALLGLASLPLWAEFCAKAANGGKPPIFFQQAGTLVLAHRQDWLELDAFQAAIARKMPQLGVTSTSSQPQLLNASGIAALEPELGDRFQRGLFLPDDGQIDSRALLSFLALRLVELGVVWQAKAPVIAVNPYQIVVADGPHAYDLVIDARGLGARKQLPLRGVRGELLWLSAPEVSLSRPVRLIHPRYPLYISPRPGHRFLAGATSIESDHQGGVTVKSALELLSAAYSLHPGFAEAEILETKVQLRPALPDNLPRIYHRSGLIRINGLYRHGYLIGPALALEVLQLVKHCRSSQQFTNLVEEDRDCHSDPQRTRT